MSPVEATRKAMGQITGALVGVAVVLSAVFVPVAFSGGSVGAIYRQFSLTIVSAMLLSVFVALSLTPALCATMLKPVSKGARRRRRASSARSIAAFEHGRDKYLGGVRHVINRFGRWLLIYAAVIVAVGLLFVRLPTGFLPDEDQGIAFIQVQTPPGATQGQTEIVLDDVSNYLLKEETAAVDATFEINGLNFAGRGQSQGMVFVRFKDWSVRKTRRPQGAGGPRAHGQAFRVVPGRGHRSDQSTVDSRAGNGVAASISSSRIAAVSATTSSCKARDQLLTLAKQDPNLALVRANGLPDNPTFKIDIDREKASAFGINLSDVDQTFSIAWGSRYVNNFLDTDGRIKKVYVQADAPFRMNPEDLKGALRAQHQREHGAVHVVRERLVELRLAEARALQRRFVVRDPGTGGGRPEHRTGDGGDAEPRETAAGRASAMNGPASRCRSSSRARRRRCCTGFRSSSCFLSLAALYESWSIPISVIMVVPLGILGALAAATALHLENDVYFQVGLLTTIGLVVEERDSDRRVRARPRSRGQIDHRLCH